MAQRHSTPTLSKFQSATNVSPLGGESSPKNDVSLSEVHIGFIQLIDSDTKQILAQRQGSNDEATFEYLKANVWCVNENLVMQFVAQIHHVHPMKFFHALPKTMKVKVYHNQLTSNEPTNVMPCWEGLAAQIEDSHALIDCDQWDAFDSQGDWIGTSEC